MQVKKNIQKFSKATNVCYYSCKYGQLLFRSLSVKAVYCLHMLRCVVKDHVKNSNFNDKESFFFLKCASKIKMNVNCEEIEIKLKVIQK